MIWYDLRSGEPIAPGADEDGGPPSMEVYYCWKCECARMIDPRDEVTMECSECETPLLIFR